MEPIPNYDQEVERRGHPENFEELHDDEYLEEPLDVDPKTGKVSKWHLERCNGCALCKAEEEPSNTIED